MGNHVTFNNEITIDPATIKAARDVVVPGPKNNAPKEYTSLLLDSGKEFYVSRATGKTIHAHLTQANP